MWLSNISWQDHRGNGIETSQNFYFLSVFQVIKIIISF